jgi:hypothetical protein
MLRQNNNIFDFLRGGGEIKNYCRGNIFVILKIFIILLRPNIKSWEKYNDIMININIYEAVISDIIQNKDYLNSLYGLNLTLLLPIMKQMNLLGCDGFKLWCILYFFWNMKFCINRKHHKIISFAHNFPALYKTLISFEYTPDELVNNWVYLREASIITGIIQYNDNNNEK